ncbi:glycosyltransferase family 4 protein [Dyella silvae]|uniref:glycosyltransferase family 4 protein n=1 Tax=Dyella silvae TaxID=2994424 RepID=UPI0022643380|nr:glycosyltransferase family 4 protein [Dyella silvae]
MLTSTYPRWSGDPEPGFVHELARRLTDRFDVHVIGPHAPGAKNRETLDGVVVHRYRYAPRAWETLVNDGGMLANIKRSPWKWLLVPGFLLGQWYAVRKAVRSYRPHVVHAHWMLPQGLIAAIALRDVPWVVTSHGADLYGLRGRWFARMRRWVLGRAAIVTLVSEAMRVRLLTESSGVKTAVMPMGVDTDSRFTPGGKGRNPNELLFVGRLVEKKGLHHLLHALPQILVEHPKARLTIVGFGPEEQRLRQITRDLTLEQHVQFVGALPQEALADHYRRACLFVAPFIEAGSGDQEGLGLVVAEAMACACPVVVGDVPAVHDLTGAAGGVSVDATNHSALANTINHLLRDSAERSRLGMSGRLRAEQLFSWRKASDQYADLLSALVKKRAS